MSTLAPMTEVQYLEYIAEAIPAYAAEKVAAGQWSKEESLELSRRSLEELLPQGLSTPDNNLFMVHDPEAQVVGMLWIAVQSRAGQRIAYVYDVIIKAEHRRKGHATRAFLAIEDEVRRLGLAGIALHVFGHNTAAQALYARLGYQPTNISLFKAVGRRV
jgi:ribosomal protein S18 acetylase RimI-like enzyme